MNTPDQQYAGLVRALQSGNRIDGGTIQRFLRDAGRTADELLTDAFGTADRLRSGDPCGNCGGHLTIVDSRVKAGRRIQFLGCRSCGFRPDDNKRIGNV